MAEFSSPMRPEMEGWMNALQEVIRQAVASLPLRALTSMSLMTKQTQNAMRDIGAYTQATMNTVMSMEMHARLVKLGLGSTSLALVGAAVVMVTILFMRMIVIAMLPRLFSPAAAYRTVASPHEATQNDDAVASSPNCLDGNLSHRNPQASTVSSTGAARPTLPSMMSIMGTSAVKDAPRWQEPELEEHGAVLPKNGRSGGLSLRVPPLVGATGVRGTRTASARGPAVHNKGALGAKTVGPDECNTPLVADGAAGWGMKLLSASTDQRRAPLPPTSSSAAGAQPLRIYEDGNRTAWSESSCTKASAFTGGRRANGVVEADMPVGSASHRLGSSSGSAMQKTQIPPQAVSDLPVGSAGKPDESSSSMNGMDVTSSTVTEMDESSPHHHMGDSGNADDDDMPVSWLCCGVGGVTRRRQPGKSRLNSRGSSADATPDDKDSRRPSQRRAASKQATDGTVSVSQFQAESTPAPPDDTSVPKPAHANHSKPRSGAQPHSPAGVLESGSVRTSFDRDVVERLQATEDPLQALTQDRARSGSPSSSQTSLQHAGVNGYSVFHAAGRSLESVANGPLARKRETSHGTTGSRSCTNSPPRSPTNQQQRRRPSYDAVTLDSNESSSAYSTWNPGVASHPGFIRRLSDRIRQRLSHDGGEHNPAAGHNPLAQHGVGGGKQRRRTEELVSMLENPRAAVMGTAQRPEGGVCLRHDIHPDDTSSPVANSWSGFVSGDSFQVRGKEYLSNKMKIASEESMYEVVQVEAYRTDRRMLNVTKLLEITSDTVSGLPTTFVLNIAIPDYTPDSKLWGKPSGNNDGPGISVIVHAKMTKETREALQAGSTRPEHLLLRQFLEGDDNSAVVDDDSELVDKFPHENKYRRQMKMLAVVRGGADQLPRLVRFALNRGNSKPFLVNRCGIAIPRAQPGVFEFCVDVHNFQQLAVTTLNKCKDYFLKLVVDVCVLLEGQESSELPERVLMCVRLCYPDFKNVGCHIDDVTPGNPTASNE